MGTISHAGGTCAVFMSLFESCVSNSMPETALSPAFNMPKPLISSLDLRNDIVTTF